MDPHFWIGFALASLVMGVIPGPGVMSIIGYTIGSGCRTALASVAGMAVGNITATRLSFAGVGALLATSAPPFLLLKWLRALYLIALGINTTARSSRQSQGGPSPAPISPRVAFTSNVAVGVFHPKAIVFFVSFAPQFITSKGDYATQAAILVSTFDVVVGCTDTISALGAAKASFLFRRSGVGRWTKRASDGVLIAAGVTTVAAHDFSIQ